MCLIRCAMIVWCALCWCRLLIHAICILLETRTRLETAFAWMSFVWKIFGISHDFVLCELYVYWMRDRNGTEEDRITALCSHKLKRWHKCCIEMYVVEVTLTISLWFTEHTAIQRHSPSTTTIHAQVILCIAHLCTMPFPCSFTFWLRAVVLVVILTYISWNESKEHLNFCLLSTFHFPLSRQPKFNGKYTNGSTQLLIVRLYTRKVITFRGNKFESKE